MKAVRLKEGQVQTQEVELKEAESKEWIEIQVTSAGICGSDLKMLELGIFGPGITIGHEYGGILPDGTVAAIEPITTCGVCQRCQEGRYNLCEMAIQTVAGMGADGGMAEAALVHKSQAVALPDGADPKHACLVEPLAVCVHGFERAGINEDNASGMRMVIIGGGTIGQCALGVAKSYGAEAVLMSRHPAQKEAAEKMGADPMQSEAASSYDLVIDAAGTNDALAEAAKLARPGAKMMLLATYWGRMELPGTELSMKEIDVIPAIMYCSSLTASAPDSHSTDFHKASKVLAENPQIPEAIITHRFGLEESEEAFRVAGDRAAGAIKVVFEPS